LILYNPFTQKAKVLNMNLFNRKSKVGNIIVRILLFFVCTLLLSYCEEETSKPRSYPRVNSFPVSDISEGGATFNAELNSLGSEPIIQHGFVWGLYAELDIKRSDRILLGTVNKIGPFSTKVFSTFIKGKEYTVKPFVQTAEHIVYGIVNNFVSLGSDAPTITGYEPHSARWMDTLTIRGKNFSYVGLENVVKLDEVNCWVASSTDTTIVVTVNTELSALKSLLSVSLAGNIAVNMVDTFRLIAPVIEDFYPKQGRWNDTLRIIGKNMVNITSSNAVYATIGGNTCKVIEKGNELVLIKVPEEINTLENSLSIKINNLSFPVSEKFTLLSPQINSISPKLGTWGIILTIKGLFHPNTARNLITIGGVKADIISNNKDSIRVTVPQSLIEADNLVVNKTDPFTMVALDTFKLQPPYIESVSPLSGVSSSTVFISGIYLYNAFSTYSVKFGSAEAQIASINETSIVCYVPKILVNGPVPVTVTVNSQSTVYKDEFVIENPVITNIYPLSATFNDEVTIEGNNFIPESGSTYVSFDGISASIKTLTNTSIVVTVPVSIDSIPRVVKVTAGVNAAISSQYFTLSPQEIYSVTPATIVGGEDITISGKNFNPEVARNQVFLDLSYLTIKTATNSQIVATVPQALSRGNLKIKVITGGYTRLSAQEFAISSQWLRIPSPILRFHDGNFGSWIPVTGGGLQNYGYLCSIVDNGLTYRFDPSDYSWTKLGTYANVDISNENSNKDQIVCQDTIYIIAGNTPVLLGIDQMNETWENKPVSIEYNYNGIAFSLNNKIYYGAKKNYNNSFVGFYEIDPSNNYSKTKTTDFPVGLNASVTTYFSIGNKGYVLFSENSFWQFDAITLQWTKLSNFPGPARYHTISFVIDEYGYMGTGYSSSTHLNDIWRYNPLTDSWTFVSSMPNPRDYAVAFTINGKAYVGYGHCEWPQYNSIDLFDFYEFDPNYPLK
jgi:hypothetical protein